MLYKVGIWTLILWTTVRGVSPWAILLRWIRRLSVSLSMWRLRVPRVERTTVIIICNQCFFHTLVLMRTFFPLNIFNHLFHYFFLPPVDNFKVSLSLIWTWWLHTRTFDFHTICPYALTEVKEVELSSPDSQWTWHRFDFLWTTTLWPTAELQFKCIFNLKQNKTKKTANFLQKHVGQ